MWPLNPQGELLVIGLIESRTGHANLERILDATDGIGVIWPTPGDLAADLGLIGQLGHPEVEEMVQQALDVCTRRGVPCAAGAHSTEEAVRRAEQGFGIVLAPPEPGLAAAVRGARLAGRAMPTEIPGTQRL